VVEGSSATVARRGGMSLVLGRKGANRASPNPQWVRDRNSPANPAMERHLSHAPDVGRSAGAVNSLSDRHAARIENSRSYVCDRDATVSGRGQMAERPVATGNEARAGSKEGVVRYVLLASLVLVVVLFLVAYELFS
jgi:hypothetical protein